MFIKPKCFFPGARRRGGAGGGDVGGLDGDGGGAEGSALLLKRMRLRATPLRRYDFSSTILAFESIIFDDVFRDLVGDKSGNDAAVAPPWIKSTISAGKGAAVFGLCAFGHVAFGRGCEPTTCVPLDLLSAWSIAKHCRAHHQREERSICKLSLEWSRREPPRPSQARDWKRS